MFQLYWNDIVHPSSSDAIRICTIVFDDAMTLHDIIRFEENRTHWIIRGSNLRLHLLFEVFRIKRRYEKRKTRIHISPVVVMLKKWFNRKWSVLPSKVWTEMVKTIEVRSPCDHMANNSFRAHTWMNINGMELNLSSTSAPMLVDKSYVYISIPFTLYSFHSFNYSIFIISFITRTNNQFYCLLWSRIMIIMISFTYQPHICRSHQNITIGIICTWQSITPFTF